MSQAGSSAGGAREVSGSQRLLWWLQLQPLRWLQGLLNVLPLRACVWLGHGIGNAMALVLRSRVRMARENAALALNMPVDDPRVRRIVRQSLRNFALVPVELLLLERALKHRSHEDILAFDGREYIDAVLAQGRGCVFLTAHSGNWEVMGALAPQQGIPLTTVGRAIKNQLVDERVNELRSRYGQRIVDKDGATLRLARDLRRGRCAGILLDTHAGRRGLRVDFLGRPASTFSTAAQLARRMKVPILPAVCWREDVPLKVRVTMGPPLEPDPDLPEDEDIYRLTLLFHRFLEKGIRARPEQWLWLHRRWKKGGREPDPAWVERYAET